MQKYTALQEMVGRIYAAKVIARYQYPDTFIEFTDNQIWQETVNEAKGLMKLIKPELLEWDEVTEGFICKGDLFNIFRHSNDSGNYCYYLLTSKYNKELSIYNEDPDKLKEIATFLNG